MIILAFMPVVLTFQSCSKCADCIETSYNRVYYWEHDKWVLDYEIKIDETTYEACGDDIDQAEDGSIEITTQTASIKRTKETECRCMNK
jgi:NAD-dependent dihydropyrimidine dehydrogenase PreA subunit